MTRDEFFARLDARPTDATAAAAMDRMLWDEIGRDRAILVSDMSGFTRLTKTGGIIDFLALFRRAVNQAAPIFSANRACFFKTAADNMMASFERVDEAISSARALSRLDLGPSRLCLGIGFGRILQFSDDVFGDEVNVAYKLGEDIATRGEILVSASAMKNGSMEASSAEGPLSIEAGGATLEYYRLR